MKIEIPDIRYVVYKQARFKDGKNGKWVWAAPYVYALTSNSRSAIAFCEFATKENPTCRVWKMDIRSNGVLPDPESYSEKSRDYFVKKLNEALQAPDLDADLPQTL